MKKQNRIILNTHMCTLVKAKVSSKHRNQTVVKAILMCLTCLNVMKVHMMEWRYVQCKAESLFQVPVHKVVVGALSLIRGELADRLSKLQLFGLRILFGLRLY